MCYHYCILVVKTQQYFVTSSCMFSDEKTVLEIWFNPGLNLTIVRGTGPWRTLEGSSSQASFYMGKNLTPLTEPKALAHTPGVSR